MSGMIPEQKDPHEHVYDLIADGCKRKVPIQDQNGNVTFEYVLDPKKVWYKTNVVNSPHFARFAKYLEDLSNMANDAFNFMPDARARVLAEQIQTVCNSYMYSIDAKSSETLRDKHNAQACLLDKGFRQKSERAITIKDEAKRSFMDAFTGKKKEEALYD